MRRFSKPFSLLGLSAYRVMPAMARANSRLIAMRGQMHLLDAMENAGRQQHEGTHDCTAEGLNLRKPLSKSTCARPDPGIRRAAIPS